VRTTLFLAVPTFLVTSNIWLAFTAPPLYEYGFSRNHVSEETGITPEDLRTIARDFIAYFSSPEEFLDLHVTVHSVEQPLLNEREIIHMRDVKHLVQGVTRVRVLSLVLLGTYIIVGFAFIRRRFLSILGRRLAATGLVTAGGVVAVGVILAAGFPMLFHFFHLVSFRNPFWLLDPRVDYLVRLFPYRFFFETTMFIALATLVEALLLTVLAWGALKVAHAKMVSSPSPIIDQTKSHM